MQRVEAEEQGYEGACNSSAPGVVGVFFACDDEYKPLCDQSDNKRVGAVEDYAR